MPKVFLEKTSFPPGSLMPDGRPWPERWCFYCPGCAAAIRAENPEYDDSSVRALSVHVMNVRDVHRFNGNIDSPTFEPSIMVSHVHVCHSFVREGSIQFLSDCTHPLANTTVDLPELSQMEEGA